jgi:hypothetical protein
MRLGACLPEQLNHFAIEGQDVVGLTAGDKL